MSQKYRSIPFTLNNYTVEESECVQALKDKVLYMIVGKEVGEQGTPHLQGYLYFKSARSLSSLKKMIPRAHFSLPCKGTHSENIDYCGARGKHLNKPGWQELLIESGESPHQGARTDLEGMVDSCKGGATTVQLIENHTDVYAKYPRFVEICKKTFAKKRDPNNPPHVKCYWGESGSGKTRTAYEEFAGECYKKDPTTGEWWDGYDADENVIIDEADKGYLKLCQLLSLLDRYPVKVNVKGTTVEFVASKIILTANKHPEDWYPNCTVQERKGLLRRMNEIRSFGNVTFQEEQSDGGFDVL